MPKMDDEDQLAAYVYRNWGEVQRRNLVPSPNTPIECLKNLLNKEYYIEYSKNQYFDLNPTVDVVVFGHTHNPALGFTMGSTNRRSL